MKKTLIMTMVFVSLCGAVFAGDIYHPIAYWMLDETSGTTVKDSAGTYNGHAVNNPVWSSNGKINGCLDFDGSNWAYFGSGTSFNFTSSNFTISFWFKTNDNKDNTGTLISKYDCGGGRQWYINQTSDGKIDFVTYHADDSLGGDTIISTAGYQDGWAYCTAIRDGNTKYLYINGALDNTGSCQGIVSCTTTRVYMGMLGDARDNFNGKIDDMRIYDYALSANEVTQLYNVPEPATLLLLGLGGLALRKKHS